MLDFTVQIYANANVGLTVETLARETLAQVHCTLLFTLLQRRTYVRKHMV